MSIRYFALQVIGKFWKGYLLAELYYCDCVWPRSCIDGLVLVYSSPQGLCVLQSNSPPEH